jgi:hypothetical protein
MADGWGGKRPGAGRPRREKRVQVVDTASVDPIEVLRAIAGDATVPANARVMAAKSLLALDRHNHKAHPQDRAARKHDAMNAAAVARLRLVQTGGDDR